MSGNIILPELGNEANVLKNITRSFYFPMHFKSQFRCNDQSARWDDLSGSRSSPPKDVHSATASENLTTLLRTLKVLCSSDTKQGDNPLAESARKMILYKKSKKALSSRLFYFIELWSKATWPRVGKRIISSYTL